MYIDDDDDYFRLAKIIRGQVVRRAAGAGRGDGEVVIYNHETMHP